MNLELSETQALLAESFRNFFANESSMKRVRAAEPLGFDKDLWRALGDLGALSMRMPDSDGLGTFDAALVMEEAGRHLASAPIVETMVAAPLIAKFGVETELARKAAEGSSVVTMSLHEAEPDKPQIVPAAAVAEAVVFFTGDELRIAALPGVKDSPSNHGSMPLSPCVLIGEGALQSKVIARGPVAREAYRAAIEEWKLLTAAALVGIGQRALELAADYAKERVQFGRPIASYQAIAHPLADRISDVTGARLLVWWAIRQIADRTPDAAAAVSMAWWWAAKASGDAVARALHTFGGYGVTLEYDIQLYHRRAKALALQFGDPRDELLAAGMRLWSGKNGALPDVGPVAIDFELGDKAEAYAAETRAFFERTLTPEWHAKSHYSYDGHDWKLYGAMGKARLLFATWPVEHGGRGADRYVNAAQLKVWEDYGVTTHALSTSTIVGHIIIRFGSETAKRDVLPKLAAGEAITSLGYTEPSSGSDVFAAQTHAVRDGDGWVINGQKMFTSGGNIASHVMLLTRTNPAVPKHKGITLFLVPMNSPGVEIHPVHTFQEERTNATFYSDVRVPDSYRLGPVDGGLEVLAWALSLEQGGGGFVDVHRHVLEAAVEWARTATRNGKPAIEDPRVLERLAEASTHVQISYLIYWRSVWLLEQGIADRATGPMSKLVSSEYYLRDATDLLDLAAPDTLLRGKHNLGLIELRHRHAAVTTIYGGTSEVHRSQVAENSFSLPKSR